MIKKMREQKFKVVEKMGGVFEAYLGKTHIGRATVYATRPNDYMLAAIDIFDESDDGGVNYQRKGYGTKLMAEVAKYLRRVGATTLHSANEGSGTVQILDRIFGRENIKHQSGCGEIDYETAIHIMDVLFGRTISVINLAH